MLALVFVEADPGGDDASGVAQGLEGMALHALILLGADDSLDHVVRLEAVRLMNSYLFRGVAPASEE